MSSSIIAPLFKIMIFQPNTDIPIEFPTKYISSISSTRGLKANSMTINFARDNDSDGLPYRYAFKDQSFVQLLVKKTPDDIFRQENLCYVSGVQSQNIPNKTTESITISGIETKLKNQNLYLDIVGNQNKKIEEIRLDSSKNNKNNFVHTLSSIGKVFEKIKTLPDLFKAVYDTFIVELSNPHNGIKFGGKSLFKKANNGTELNCLINPYVMNSGYTGSFIHVFNFISGYTIGAMVNFWDIINSVETEPLYELFFDSLESLQDENIILNTNENYKVEEKTISLVFRKTPFDYYINDLSEWNRENIKTYLPLHKIKSISSSFSQDSVYTGVHVGLSFLGQQTSALIQPPNWNLNLHSHFGYRLLSILLDGVQFEENTTLNKIKLDYIKTLKSIQDRIFKIFCGFPRVKAANVKIETQFDFFRCGIPIVFDNPEKDFGDVGYIETVTSNFTGQGQATTSLDLKWVNYDLKTEMVSQVKPTSNYNEDNLNLTQFA